MSREELRDGFVEVMGKSYGEEAYFERLDSLFVDERFRFVIHNLPYWWKHPFAFAKRATLNYVRFAVVASRLLRMVEDDEMRARYRKQLMRIMKSRSLEPHILFVYVIKMAQHYHFKALSNELAQAYGGNDVMPNAGRSFSRLRRPAPPIAAMAS